MVLEVLGPVSQGLVVGQINLQWRDGAPAVLMSRAFDAGGDTQPTMEALLKAKGANIFYHNNAIQPWRVAANGEITNGR